VSKSCPIVMNTHPLRTKTRSCAHCGQRFTINPRLGKRHRYCSRPECIKVRHRVGHKKWLRKNGGKSYYLGNHNTDRVRDWRRQHPHYWKKSRRIRRAGRADFVLTKALAAAVRFVALQDSIDTRFALEIGLISRVSGAALQDTIAKEIHRLTLRGYAILRGKSGRLPK
jgi:hypothetical protein